MPNGMGPDRLSLYQDHNDVVRKINDTLRGPAARILRDIVPDYATIGEGEFYDRVMDDTALLHNCLETFAGRRDAFRALIVDSLGRPVNDDRVHLRCGRSLQDVIAMIVRTHAKRLFRQVHKSDPNDPASRAGRIYHALRVYLLHSWQVQLVPHYAPLPVDRVIAMGPGILDLRDPAALAAAFGLAPPALPLALPDAAAAPVVPAVATPAPPAPPAPAAPSPAPPDPPARRPAPAAPAGPAFSGTPQETFWWEALSDRAVRPILGEPGPVELREMVAALASVNETVRGDLFAGLSLSTQQAAVLLGVAWKTLGRHGFTRLFGSPGQPKAVIALAARLKQRGIGSRSDLKTVAKAAETIRL